MEEQRQKEKAKREKERIEEGLRICRERAAEKARQEAAAAEKTRRERAEMEKQREVRGNRFLGLKLARTRSDALE